MTPPPQAVGNKPVSVASVNPPLRYTLREGALGAMWVERSADIRFHPQGTYALTVVNRRPQGFLFLSNSLFS